jgi:hypothetical protein
MKSLAITVAAAGALFATGPTLAQERRAASGDSVGPRHEILCRRFLRTGTLADYYRVCKTRAEWNREREERRILDVRASERTAG